MVRWGKKEGKRREGVVLISCTHRCLRVQFACAWGGFGRRPVAGCGVSASSVWR